MGKTGSFSVAAAAALVAAGWAQASTVTFVGADINKGASWRDTSVPKLYDADGNNQYGTAGYFVIASGTTASFGPSAGTNLTADPSFVAPGSQVTLGENLASGFNYALENDPTTAHPGTSNTIEAGTVTDGTADKASFTIASSGPVPADFRVAIMVDNLDAVNYNASALTIHNAANSATATAPEATGDQVPDLYVFDIQGAVNGEKFFVAATQGINGTATFAALAYDVAVPEPTSLGLAGMAGLALISRRRRTA